VQRGNAGDMTGGRSLGPWTEEMARQLMARNEIAWNEMRIYGKKRERRRQEFSDRYREHIANGDLYYVYSDYPYIEWYSGNGRVVLELDPSQLEVVEEATEARKKKTPEELVSDMKRRDEAFVSFMAGMVNDLSEENRKQGGDGNVAGIVVN